MIEDVVFLNYSFIGFKLFFLLHTEKAYFFVAHTLWKKKKILWKIIVICLALLLLELKKKPSREALDYLLLITSVGESYF